MDIQELEREFQYNGVKLADPSPAFSLTQVRDFYANIYPEIISADIEGPRQLGAKTIYTFRRAVGTKGGHCIADMVRDLAALLHVNQLESGDTEFIKELQEAAGRNQVSAVAVDDQLRLLALHREFCQAGAPC